MKQWFQGQLEGHYEGSPVERGLPAVQGEHFQIRVTRAIISDVTLIALTEELSPTVEETEEITLPIAKPEIAVAYHHETEGEVLFQDHIPEAYFLEALGPGRTVRGAAYEVLLSELTFSHPTRHDGKTYGRLQGFASGWFRPIAPQAAPLEVPPKSLPGEVWRTEISETPLKSPTLNKEPVLPPESAARAEKGHGAANGAKVATADIPASPLAEPRKKSAAHLGNDYSVSKAESDEDPEPGFIPESATAYAQTDWPFFVIGHLLTLAMMVMASVPAGLLFYACYLPPLGLRRWLYGTIPEGWFTRTLSLLLISAEVLVAALLLARFREVGCKELGPFALILLVSGPLVSSLLPRPTTFAVCLGTLALILGAYYGSFGTFC